MHVSKSPGEENYSCILCDLPCVMSITAIAGDEIVISVSCSDAPHKSAFGEKTSPKEP